MARRRNRKKVYNKNLILDKYKIGGTFVVIGCLYFFAYFLAQQSPILDFFNKGIAYIIGDIGIIPFFTVCIIFGVFFIRKGHIISLLFKQFLSILLILSALFNFEVIEKGISTITDNNEYLINGGFLSRPLLQILYKMFGNNPNANKIFVIMLGIGVLTRIFYTLNVRIPMPKMPKIVIQHDEKPTHSTRSQSESTKIRQTENEIKAKISKYKNIGSDEVQESTGLLSGIFGSKSKVQKKSNNRIFGQQVGSIVVDNTNMNHKNSNDQNSNQSNTNSNDNLGQNNLFNKILGNQLKKQVEEKIEHKIVKQIKFAEDKPTFGTDIMDSNKGNEGNIIGQEFLVQQAQAVQNKLLEFNVLISIEGFDIGPSIVQLRIKPDSGIKVSAIENLKNDLSLSLKTKSIRIIAPIPGTDCVGIQLPNPKSTMVHLGDVLDSLEFRKSMTESATNLALGVGIDGKNVIKSLERMPHLLVAGATGSGKSVGVNDFILSLMYQNTPAELKFLMIDPKQVELEFYSGLPYLMAPIVTQPDKALKLLQRSVQEMESRYTKLKNLKVKNLEEYNNKIPDDKMFRIVIVIDELADLMMSGNKKDVELCITRIAQKARAVGMHLIVATQRPSVNVLTGLIKANIPTRIAFGVVSQIDSRTILGMKGAEDLVGRGDMLYMDPNTKTPIRMQAPYNTTTEIEKIIGRLHAKYMQGLTEDDIYNPEIIKFLESKPENSLNNADYNSTGSDEDEILANQAIEVILETHKASTTMLQRKLNIGFARAARIMDMLEEKGIVGPQEGAKAREILI